MACHIRVASSNAKMGLPEVSLGLIPGYGGTQRLAQFVGKGRALEMIMTAEMITAEEAYRFGLVNHVVEADQLLEKASEILRKIIERSPFAISSAIRAVNAGFESGQNGYCGIYCATVPLTALRLFIYVNLPPARVNISMLDLDGKTMLRGDVLQHRVPWHALVVECT